MRQFFGLIDWERKAAVFFIALLILVVVGPFGTYNELPLARRFVYWTILMLGIGFLMHICMFTALNSKHLAGAPRFVRLLIGSAIAAIPSAGIVGFVQELFRGTIVTFDLLKLVWFQITVIGFVIGGVEFLIGTGTTEPEPEAPRSIKTDFHDRLKAPNGDIISMSMQDHYVEVTTTTGKELILIRFSDALAEIKGLVGQRIHRSHWIAAAHLRSLEKDGPRHLATLSDGRTLPVSATYADKTAALLQKNQ